MTVTEQEQIADKFSKEQKIEAYKHYIGEYLHGRVNYPDLTSEQHMRTFEHFWRTPNTDYFIEKWWKLQQQTAEVECACGDCLPHGSDLALKMGWRYVEDELTCGNCIAATPTKDKVKELKNKAQRVVNINKQELGVNQIIELQEAIDELEKALK